MESLRKDEGLKEALASTKMIAFDVDGTLTDSIDQIITCFGRTFRHCGLPVPSDEAIKGTIGMTLHLGIQSLLPDPTDDKLGAEVTKIYRDTFAHEPDINVTKFFPDILETLDVLKQKGFILAIASGKSRVGVDRVLNDEPRLKEYISHVMTGDRCESKPSPAMIFELAKMAKVDPTEVMGIGDAVLDVQMCHNANSKVVGVLTGVSDFKALVAANTKFIIPKATDLISYL